MQPVDQAAGSNGALFHRWRKRDHQLGMDHRRVPADCLPDKLATSDKKPVAVFHILTTRTPPRPSYTTSVDSTAGLRRPLLPLSARPADHRSAISRSARQTVSHTVRFETGRKEGLGPRLVFKPSR